MTPEQIVRILKDKEDYANVIEIKDNAKGEQIISVKVRDDNAQAAIDRSIESYRKVRIGLKKLK